MKVSDLVHIQYFLQLKKNQIGIGKMSVQQLHVHMLISTCLVFNEFKDRVTRQVAHCLEMYLSISMNIFSNINKFLFKMSQI